MNKLWKILVLTACSVGLLAATPVYADCFCCFTYSDNTYEIAEGTQTNLLGDENGCYCGNSQGSGINDLLATTIRVASSLVLILAIVGVIIVGIMYLSARDNEGQVIKAKSRLLHVVIGLIAYALLWTFLNWLVPGGILNDSGKRIVKTESRVVDNFKTAGLSCPLPD